MLNIAIVGTGGHANWHAEQIKKVPEIKVVALCDIVPEKVKAYREKHFPDAVEFHDFYKLIENPPAKLDGVILVTPHTVHYPHAKAALEKGINVLCEKPLVTNVEHAYDLWKTSKRTGKLMAIAIQAPYSPEYQTIARMRDSGELGKPQLIQGWLAQGWRHMGRDVWRYKPELSGGGQMYDSGAHVLNAMMWIMNDPVVEVACFYDKIDMPVDINGVVIMKFQNGAMGSVCIGGNSPGWQQQIRLQTDKLQLTTGIHGWELDIQKPGGRKFYPTVEMSDRPGFGTPHVNFVDALTGKAKPINPVRYGVLLSALMDAMYESADNRKVVQVKPVPTDI
jgi:predicted dehydrogenase